MSQPVLRVSVIDAAGEKCAYTFRDRERGLALSKLCQECGFEVVEIHEFDTSDSRTLDGIINDLGTAEVSTQ